VTVDAPTAPPRIGEVLWVRYSTTVLRTARASIVFDPIGALPGIRPDLVCVSHEHSDHFDRAAVASLAAAGARVIAPPSISEALGARWGTRSAAVRPGDRIAAGDVSVSVAACNHAADDPVTYLIELDSGHGSESCGK
jgi:L-ascorbate metabolism protein UlaG (beta-lactamase superfamily)